MRIAFFSPMPPARSGIADYSAALAGELRYLSDLTVFDGAQPVFDPAEFDVALYQIGNNADHDFVYETALRHPGVAVVHEANLHHLIADTTIRRGDWDAYVRECEFDCGADAAAFAERVRALQVGPDYEGVPMLRRLAGAARGVIAHSSYVLNRVNAAGFEGPSAVIPHGAWVDPSPVPDAHSMSRNSVRSRLGIDPTTPLLGIFGHLKPYKRISESLRAMRRLVRLDDRVKMIIVGEPHPDFAIRELIRTLDLEAHVRILGYTPVADFAAYIGACDVILNLRHPTVGESSGSLLRALGAGRPALVSDAGAFSELPDDICVKLPVGPDEEDLIFEYLNLLVSQPDLAREIGTRARAWAERECSWPIVARRYAAFLEEVVYGPSRSDEEEHPLPKVEQGQPSPLLEIGPDAIQNWSRIPGGDEYLGIHSARLNYTLKITPPGDASKSILEMGSYLQITPALKFKLGYGTVRGCYYGRLGRSDRRFVESLDGVKFECVIDHFDAEKDPYPYPDESFDTVLCCELIEHLFADPMHLMSEVNRILKPSGSLVITTPNITSLRAISGVLNGYHPGLFPNYIKPDLSGETDARHNREYAPREIHDLLTNSGFDVTLLDSGPFREEPHPEFHWVKVLLERLTLHTYWRDDGIYAVGRKTGPVRERWPAWLYS